MKLTKRLNYIIKISIGIIIGVIISLDMLAQTLTLQACQEKAESLSPLKKQEQYIASIEALNKQVIQTNWLPSVNLTGRVSYQSDVFGLPFTIPGADVPQVPNDQYQLNLQLQQTIFDGGATKAATKLESAKTDLRAAQLEVSLYQVKQVINELYFGILMLDTQRAINESILNDLDVQLNKAQSAVKNGIMLSSELKSLKKQQLTIVQQQNNLELRKSALLKVLSDWIGYPISSATRLELPLIKPATKAILRPEMNVFEKHIAQLNAQKAIQNTQNRPKLSVFATTGLGAPNPYNFFETDLNGYYMIGGQLQWSLWDWNRSNKQNEILKINQEIIMSERLNFEKNINKQLLQQESEIDILEASLETDLELLELQKEITKTASSQLGRGVISASDYLLELNALVKSELQYKLHQIELIKAQVTQRTITGQSLNNE